MDYERIDKPQAAGISPKRLRLMLLGPYNHKKSEAGNSSRTSPSKLEELECSKSSLLLNGSNEFVSEGSLQHPSCASPFTVKSVKGNQESYHLNVTAIKNVGDGCIQISKNAKGFAHINSNGTPAAMYPVRPSAEVNPDYGRGHDSCSSTFEFQQDELSHVSAFGPFFRPVPSKWNDAEKWIPACHAVSNIATKNMRENCSSIRLHPILGCARGTGAGSDLSSADFSMSTMRRVSMKDMGTEMTPFTSQEPSRNGTPVGLITPILSPTSVPLSPKRGDPPQSSTDIATDGKLVVHESHKNHELSERELQVRTRKEIVALGLQLGKMNIAAWASREDNAPTEILATEQPKKCEFETQAAAWEEAEQSKHKARYKREEIKIQAWESHQKAKFESEMRKIEAVAERRKAQAQEKMMNRLEILGKQADEKRVVARARMNQHAARTANQVEWTRQTGKLPATHFLCCSCFH